MLGCVRSKHWGQDACFFHSETSCVLRRRTEVRLTTCKEQAWASALAYACLKKRTGQSHPLHTQRKNHTGQPAGSSCCRSQQTGPTCPMVPSRKDPCRRSAEEMGKGQFQVHVVKLCSYPLRTKTLGPYSVGYNYAVLRHDIVRSYERAGR